MFYTCCHSVLLNTLNIRNHHARCQIWIFAHVFKISPIEWSSVNVYSRSQQHIFISVTRFFTDSYSIVHCHLRIETCRHTSECRKCSTRIVCPAGSTPFIPKYFFADTMRPIICPHFRNSKTWNTAGAKFRLCMTHSHFLFERHQRKYIFYSFFNRLI